MALLSSLTGEMDGLGLAISNNKAIGESPRRAHPFPVRCCCICSFLHTYVV